MNVEINISNHIYKKKIKSKRKQKNKKELENKDKCVLNLADNDIGSYQQNWATITRSLAKPTSCRFYLFALFVCNANLTWQL